MKIAAFRNGANNQLRHGLVRNNRVYVIDGDIFGRFSPSKISYPMEDVQLCPPTSPTNFWAVGLNYAAHNAQRKKEYGASKIKQLTKVFRPWHKGVGSLIGSGASIVLPSEADVVHHEGELVIVIGRSARRISPKEAPHFIMGYTCGNDVSGMGTWGHDPSNWRAKGSDTFGPVGPWIETAVNPHTLEIITRINGEEIDRGNTSEMVHDCYAIVSGISQFVTLHPGDLILTGAPGVTTPIRPGDIIEIEIPGIGILTNPVVGDV